MSRTINLNDIISNDKAIYLSTQMTWVGERNKFKKISFSPFKIYRS